jgi:long-chain acyl-CoA synthetase
MSGSGASTCPPTFGALLAGAVARHGAQPALCFRDAGEWRRLDWTETGSLVLQAAAWLERIGPSRCVSLVAPASPGHWILQMAALLTGRSVNLVYADATPDDIGRVLRAVEPELIATADVDALAAVVRETGVGAGVVHLDRAFEEWLPRLPPRADRQAVVKSLERAGEGGGGRVDPALYLQSTGSTGPARVIHLRGSAALAAAWATRSAVAGVRPRLLALLPSGHVSHTLINVLGVTLLGGEVWFGGGIDTLVDDLKAAKPTVLFASPLLYQEVRAQVRAELGRSRLGRVVWRRLERRSAESLRSNVLLRGGAPLLGRLIGRRASGALGLDQVQELFSGTSPLDPELHAFCATIGWFVRNTYGLSECGGAATVSGPVRMTPGELGEPVEGMAVRLGAAGEILLQGRSLMAGYVGETPLGPDRWLPTGDTAVRGGDGALRFAGRMSSLVRLEAGVTTLDALEALVEAMYPSTQAVVRPRTGGEPGCDLWVFRAMAPLGGAVAPEHPLPTLCQLSAWLLDGPRGGLHVVRAVAVVPEPLAPDRGELGPTGKVRRWRVSENWHHRLMELERAADPGMSAA